MKVILQQDVRGQGKKGQLIEVSDGYARNFLLPRNLAIAATTDNMNAMKIRERALQKQAEREKAEAQELAKKLDGCVVKISAKSGGSGRLFGAVTSKEIADALSEQYGVAIEKNKIVQTEPIKTYGTFAIKAKLGYEVTGTINVIVTEAK